MKLFSKLFLALGIAAALFVSCNKENGNENDGPESKIPVYKTVTVAEFLKLTADGTYYHIKGTVKEITDNHYSQFVLEDKTGSVTVYGLWSGEGGTRVYDMDGYKVGDEISIAAQFNSFKGNVEAKNAYIYDPAKVMLWISPLDFEAGSEECEFTATMYVRDIPTIRIECDWITGDYDEVSETLTVKVKANTGLDIRVGYLTVYVGETYLRIRVTQEAYVPETVKISDALKLDFARVNGQIGAMGSNGYVITDSTGAIFVRTDSFLGLDLGTSMDISGNISTANYLTVISPDALTKGSAGTISYNAAEFTCADAKTLIAGLSGKAADQPGAINLKCVNIKGMLNAEADGAYALRDYDTDEIIVWLDNPKSFEMDAFKLLYVDVIAYISEYKDGKLWAIPGTMKEVDVNSAVTIDGAFNDWASISGYTQNVEDNPVVGLKYYVAGTNIYMYIKVKADAFTEFGGLKYFAQVYFNTDCNTATGPVAWVFDGLETTQYLYMCDGNAGFTDHGNGSVMFHFMNGDGKPFISANSSLFEGTFTGDGGTSFQSGGAFDQNNEYAEFEWVASMSKLEVPRHQTVLTGVRFCHEGPNTPSGKQENFFIPSDGWYSFDIK